MQKYALLRDAHAPSGSLSILLIVGVLVSGTLTACGDTSQRSSGAGPDLAPGAAAGVDGGNGDATSPALDAFDVPISTATVDERTAFAKGDDLFDLPLRDSDGLGPLYTRDACGGCHDNAVRGPGSVEKMVVVIDAESVVPASDQSALRWGDTVHPLLAGGGRTPVEPPADVSHVKISRRLGPSVLGRGYMEAVLDAEIERVAAEQATRSDSIHGRINHVLFQSERSADARFHNHSRGDAVIGRFGLKARIGTLDDFTADALQNDMGITSPLRPQEIPNPDNLTDDLKPGVDASLQDVAARTLYMRLIAIPRRSDGSPEMASGAALFARTKCAVCHVPALETRADYPIAGLAGIAAPVYTDFLLHDMGVGLADGIVESEAGPADWRTPPLIGLRFVRTFLHDARATTLRDAILQHDGPGSEAAEAASLFRALSGSEQDVLLQFVGAL